MLALAVAATPALSRVDSRFVAVDAWILIDVEVHPSTPFCPAEQDLDDRLPARAVPFFQSGPGRGLIWAERSCPRTRCPARRQRPGPARGSWGANQSSPRRR